MSFSTHEASGVGTADEAVLDWQERALERSLAPTRARSVERLGQFVDAARDLATETGSADFTVQQLVSRAGGSLKSFYRYFEGKDDLILALLEEDSRVGAALLRELVDESSEPQARLQRYIDGLFRFLAIGPRGYVTLLVREHRRLSFVSPEKMRHALAPFHELLVDELTAASAARVVRPGDFDRHALTIFDLVLSNMHEVVLGPEGFGPRDASRYVWDFVWAGLEARGA
jgi:AcrR family transcriptional regulator